APGSTISVLLPRGLVDRTSNGQRLHGTCLQAGSALNLLLSDLILSLSKSANSMEQDDALAVEEPVIALLTAGLTRQASPLVMENPMLFHILQGRVMEYIDANLLQSELGPETIMRRFQV